MFEFQSRRARAAPLAVALATVLCAGTVQAGSLRVTAVNADGNAVYDVNFSGAGGTTTTLNTDPAVHNSFRSMAYIPNAATGRLDLLVADTLGGAIVRYAGASGASTTVWNSGSGPRHPDGLSVDAAGNLYVISYTCGDDARSELWVLPHDPQLPSGAGFLAPRLIDATFGGYEAESLKDTLVVRTVNTAAGLGAGDLLLLVGDDDAGMTQNDNDDGRVLLYSAASIQAVINGGGPVSPTRSLVGPSQFPAGSYPVGMDFWPADNSLLIATTTGSILRYSISATSSMSLANFANGLGAGLGKLKAGQQAGVPYVFALQGGQNRILEFGAPPSSGPNPPLAIVTQNVSNPQGLAAFSSSAGFATAAQCASAAGCDILGGVISHRIVVGLQPVSGLVFEESCVVDPDPRLVQFGTCTGHTLPVSQLCPGYGNTVIPDTLCGASGTSGKGFALVRTIADGVDTVPGILVYSEAFADRILGGTSNPPCPQTSAGWAPRSGSTEGTVVEGDFMLELSGGCGSTRVITRGGSIYGIGLKLNTNALPPGATTTKRLAAFADQKFGFLNQSLSSANSNIGSQTRARLTACSARAQWHLDAGRYVCAARKVWRCDQIAANNLADFGSSANDPNPYGDVRGRLANLFLTIDARILGHAPASAWPLPSPPGRCPTNPEDD